MKTINLIAVMPEDYIVSLEGEFLDESHYDYLIQADTDVFKPDGSTLIKFRKRCLDVRLCDRAREALKELPLKYTGSNRGMAAGKDRVTEMSALEGRPIASKSGSRFRVLRKDGRLSNTVY